MKNINKIVIAIIIALGSTNIQAQTNKKMKVLFVLTSHNQLGNTGKKTGFWIEEFATPYYYFVDKNIEVVIATPSVVKHLLTPKAMSQVSRLNLPNGILLMQKHKKY